MVLGRLSEELHLQRNKRTFFTDWSYSHSLQQKIDYTAIADRVHDIEGEQQICKQVGLYNHYGFKYGTDRKTCYSSPEFVKQLVMNWFETKIQTMDLQTALCYYNLGIKINKCTYEQNYFKK